MTSKDKMVLQKIISYIDDVVDYVKGLDFEAFLQDKKTMTACAFSVSQIGELVNGLTQEVQDESTNIPWRSIRGMRNKIVHDYEKIDFMVLWGTIKTSLPELKNQLEKLLEQI